MLDFQGRFGLAGITEHDRIQVTSALEFIEKIDWSVHKRVADLGAGPGHHSKVIKSFGPEVVCIDFKKPFYADLPWAAPGTSAGTFDAAWSHHCLEHIRDPIGALAVWNDLLSPGGMLYLTVPQVDYVMSSGHLNAYTLPLLMYHLAAAGFDCSGKRFIKSRSHLRAAVVKAKNYSPSDGIVLELQDLARLGRFPKSVTTAIMERGRFTAEDIHLHWYGRDLAPQRGALTSAEFVSSSFWAPKTL